MNPVLDALHEIARLNHRLFHNCLEDVDAEQWTRVQGKANSMAFLALHTLGARQYLIKDLGIEVDLPILAALKDVNSAEELKDVPGIDEVKAAWDELGGAMAKALGTVSEERLAEDTANPFPTGNTTRQGALNFLIAHESYHLGQMAFLRRIFGLDPMKYS